MLTLLRKVREVRDESTDLKETVHGINDAFRNITTFNMPYPGQSVVRGSSSTKRWKVKGLWNKAIPIVGPAELSLSGAQAVQNL